MARALGAETPAYTVSVSPRAKHVRLKLSRSGQLQVVVPRGYDQRQLPAVIAAKRDWLERSRARLDRELQGLPAEQLEAIPGRLCLCAVGIERAVRRQAAAGARVRLVESAAALTLIGPVDDSAACKHRLRVWLRETARATLLPWLRQVSRELRLPYARGSIRSQRTRWGSCSATGTISLNDKLLFLPASQVHYLLCHELCHTRYLDHSLRYWALVARKMPDYAHLDAAMRDGWRYVPQWVED